MSVNEWRNNCPQKFLGEKSISPFTVANIIRNCRWGSLILKRRGYAITVHHSYINMSMCRSDQNFFRDKDKTVQNTIRTFVSRVQPVTMMPIYFTFFALLFLNPKPSPPKKL